MTVLHHIAGPGGTVISYPRDNSDQSPETMDAAGEMVPGRCSEHPDHREESAGRGALMSDKGSSVEEIRVPGLPG